MRGTERHLQVGGKTFDFQPRDKTSEVEGMGADVAGRAAETGARRIREPGRGRGHVLDELVEAGNSHEVVTRLITDVADAVTRRLLVLAEAELDKAVLKELVEGYW